MSPLNLDGSTGVYVGGLVGIAFVVAALLVGAMFAGIDERSTPMLMTALMSIGTIVTVLVGALRAEEARKAAATAATQSTRAVSQATTAAVKAEATNQTVELTASKIATVQQLIEAGECDGPNCPLKALRDTPHKAGSD